jgi:hypothetical protein
MHDFFFFQNNKPVPKSAYYKMRLMSQNSYVSSVEHEGK